MVVVQNREREILWSVWRMCWKWDISGFGYWLFGLVVKFLLSLVCLFLSYDLRLTYFIKYVNLTQTTHT